MLQLLSKLLKTLSENIHLKHQIETLQVLFDKFSKFPKSIHLAFQYYRIFTSFINFSVYKKCMIQFFQQQYFSAPNFNTLRIIAIKKDNKLQKKFPLQ